MKLDAKEILERANEKHKSPGLLISDEKHNNPIDSRQVLAMLEAIVEAVNEKFLEEGTRRLEAENAIAKILNGLAETCKILVEKRVRKETGMPDRRKAERRDSEKRPVILPCPFGHIEKSNLQIADVFNGMKVVVRCLICNGEGPPTNGRRGAIEHWNTRTEAAP